MLNWVRLIFLISPGKHILDITNQMIAAYIIVTMSMKVCQVVIFVYYDRLLMLEITVHVIKHRDCVYQ